MSNQPTLLLNDNESYCHHMWASKGHEFPQLKHGMSLRQTLKTLREGRYGDMGGTFPLELSDGTFLIVELERTSNGRLLSSQYIRRYEHDSRAMHGERTVRRYNL